MPNHQAPDFSRLEVLRDRFNDAALTYPAVNAVIVFQPDIRRKEAIRQVVEVLKRQDTSVYTGDGKYEWDAHGFARRSADWVPCYDKSIDDMGCQRYWRGDVFEPIDDSQSYWKFRTRWDCAVYGPPVGHINPAQSVLTVLSADAAKLVLGDAGADRDLITNWLVHLATQPEESSTHRPRQYLDFSRYPHASWSGVNPQRPHAWWAIRLENVFHHSGKAVQKAIDASAGATGAIPREADAADAQAHLRRMLAAVGDENAVRIMSIAQRQDMTVEQKLPLLAEVDRRMEGKTSEELAGLLGVKGSAVRQTDWWRKRKERLADR